MLTQNMLYCLEIADSSHYVNGICFFAREYENNSDFSTKAIDLKDISLGKYIIQSEVIFQTAKLSKVTFYKDEQYIYFVGLLMAFMDDAAAMKYVKTINFKLLKMLELLPIYVYMPETGYLMIRLRDAMYIIQLMIIIISDLDIPKINKKEAKDKLDSLMNTKKKINTAREKANWILEIETYIFDFTSSKKNSSQLFYRARHNQNILKHKNRFCDFPFEDDVDIFNYYQLSLIEAERIRSLNEANIIEQEEIEIKQKLHLKEKKKQKRLKHKFSVRSRVDFLLDAFTDRWTSLIHKGLEYYKDQHANIKVPQTKIVKMLPPPSVVEQSEKSKNNVKANTALHCFINKMKNAGVRCQKS